MKKFNLKKTYYVGVRYSTGFGYVYSVYSQTNNVEKALSDAYRYGMSSGSCSTGIVLVCDNDRLYEIENTGDFEWGDDGKRHFIYIPDYETPINEFSTYFKSPKNYYFDGSSYIEI